MLAVGVLIQVSVRPLRQSPFYGSFESHYCKSFPDSFGCVFDLLLSFRSVYGSYVIHLKEEALSIMLVTLKESTSNGLYKTHSILFEKASLFQFIGIYWSKRIKMIICT